MSQTQTSDNSRTFRVLNLTDEVKDSVEKLNVLLGLQRHCYYWRMQSK